MATAVLDPPSDERTFLRKIVRERTNTVTLLVFADWLEDRDDPRGLGYRVIGRFRRRPTRTYDGLWTWFDAYDYPHSDGQDNLPSDWLRSLREWQTRRVLVGWRWVSYRTVAAAYDAAARAFGRLPPRRRASLLRPGRTSL